jgi:4-hydroxyisophthalate hydroxylase
VKEIAAMPSRQSFDVIVVGGGPVGLGLAIELGQRGHTVAVIERYHAPQPIPKGQNLTQRTVEHFHFWGCEPELRAARIVPRNVSTGGLVCYKTLLSGYHHDWMQRSQVRPYYFCDNERLPQYATEAVLRARAAQIATISIFYGTTAATLVQDAAGVEVTIDAVDGSDERRTLFARYCVGCDGSRSVVREAAGIPQTKSDHDKVMVLLVFRSPELHQLLAHLPERSVYNALHPDLDGYWRFFGRVDMGIEWFFHAPVPAGTTKDNFDFACLLQEAVGQPFAHDLTYVGFWDLRFALADRYRNGRIFIAGDAAHSHPPYGGYGINTGFEDARNLGWKLSAALQGWAGEGLLQSYEAERQPVFASTARDFIEAFIVEDRAFLAHYAPERDAAEFEQAWQLRNADSTAVTAFEPNYEGSAITCGAPDLQPGAHPSARGSHQFFARAGHHLAPATLADGANVYDRLGPGFTLLVSDAYAVCAQAFQIAAAARGMPLTILQDNGGAANARYGAGIILVRPDQFVAWTDQSQGGGTSVDVDAILSQAAGHL